MTEKYIKALEEIHHPKISNKYDLQAWKTQAINIVVRLYGEDSKQEEQINLVKYQNYPSISTRNSTSGGGNNSNFCEKQASEIIGSFISDLSTFGLPVTKKQPKDKGINISVNQSQNQSISINVIWESIEDELTGKQLKEVKSIVEEDSDSETKKTKIFKKIKSFGGDIASNIIASILTNPNIYV